MSESDNLISNTLNEILEAKGLPTINLIDGTFPEGSAVAIVNLPLPPGIEEYRLRLVEIIDAIDAEAKAEVDRLRASSTEPIEKQVMKIIDRAQERAQGFIMELSRIEELYGRRAAVVNLSATPSGSEPGS